MPKDIVTAMYDTKSVIKEIQKRQQGSWHKGAGLYDDFPAIQELFQIINSGIERDDFFFSGDIFRLHTPFDIDADNTCEMEGEIIGKIYIDNSCLFLPKTVYNNNIVAFCKNCDFTRDVFYKVAPNMPARLIHVNTGSLYGIDVNKFMDKFGCKMGRYEKEEEILFPLDKEYVVKEYKGTPRKFKYYLRRFQ